MKTKGEFLAWISRQLATVFGLGYVPKAPGTWGTLAAMPLVALLSRLGPLETLIATFAVTVLGVWAAEVYVASSSQGDPQEVIIDEVAGYLIAMVWLPLTPFYFVGTFLVFRFLDILKPPPISLFDLKDKGGVGVMVDDIVAGLLTNLLFQWIFQAGVLKGWM